MSERLGNLIIGLLSVAILGVMILYATLPSLSYFQSSSQVQGVITVGQANFEFVNDLPLFSDLTDFVGGTINESVTVINARDKVGANTTNLVDCYLRFSIPDNDALSINYDSSKFLQDGTKFYYKDVFEVGQSLTLIESFEIDPQQDLSVYETGLDVQIDVEIMQATKSLVAEFFTDAPQEWIDIL